MLTVEGYLSTCSVKKESERLERGYCWSSGRVCLCGDLV